MNYALLPQTRRDMLSDMNETNTVREDGADVYITLTQGQITVVDSEDFKTLRNFKWFAHAQNLRGEEKIFRAARKEYGGTILMHRQIMNAPDGFDVDHIDMNPLNNRRANLRICTRSQNIANSKKRTHSKSPFKGVSWNTTAMAWAARIGVGNKRVFLGYFNTSEEAAKAYDVAANKSFGEFARLNGAVQPENAKPRTPHHNTSGFPGVSWKKDSGKWMARVTTEAYKRISLGFFDSAEAAAEAIKQYSKSVPTA